MGGESRGVTRDWMHRKGGCMDIQGSAKRLWTGFVNAAGKAGRSGKQEQEENSRNLGPASKPIPVHTLYNVIPPSAGGRACGRKRAAPKREEKALSALSAGKSISGRKEVVAYFGS